MKTKDRILSKKSDASTLSKEVTKLREELSKSRIEGLGKQQKNLKKAKNTRREIAQLLTIIREKQLSNQTKKSIKQ